MQNHQRMLILTCQHFSGTPLDQLAMLTYRHNVATQVLYSAGGGANPQLFRVLDELVRRIVNGQFTDVVLIGHEVCEQCQFGSLNDNKLMIKSKLPYITVSILWIGDADLVQRHHRHSPN